MNANYHEHLNLYTLSILSSGLAKISDLITGLTVRLKGFNSSEKNISIKWKRISVFSIKIIYH